MMTRTASLLLAVMALSAGCAGTGGPGAPAPGTGTKLDDRTFLSTSVKPRALVPGTRISLTFKQGQVMGNAGCNSFSGDVTIDGDKLVAKSFVTTDMGCDKARHDQDEWITKFLSEKPAFTLTGDDLVLTGGDTEIKLLDREVADPDRPLLGPRWTVDTLIEGQSASSVPSGAEAFVIFGEGDKITGNTGCNALTGTAKITGAKVTFGPIGTTKKACPGPAGQLEQAVLAVLNGEVILTIEADRLTLTHPSGKGLQLKASV